MAGGFERAVERAAATGCDCLQIFTKNNTQWRARSIEEEEGRRFQARLAELHIRFPLAHSSYLLNLASPDRRLWNKSINALVVEILRAHTLGIPFVVVHPGACVASSVEQGLARIVGALDETFRQTPGVSTGCLLETTAGQGTSLGWRFEHLAELIDRARSPERLGVCFDTCHVFAAGYALAPQEDYRATMRQFQRVVGIHQIKAFHLNDSQCGLGSRVDRHAHIGRGRMGREPFRLLLNDRRFARIPMYLETPKGTEKGTDWDRINLQTLRRLVGRRRPQ